MKTVCLSLESCLDVQKHLCGFMLGQCLAPYPESEIQKKVGGGRHRVEIGVRVYSARLAVHVAHSSLGELKSITIETLMESNSGGSSWVVNKGGSGGSGICRALSARRRSADFCADSKPQFPERQFYSNCHELVL